jgi:hypothetical protein
MYRAETKIKAEVKNVMKPSAKKAMHRITWRICETVLCPMLASSVASK